MILLNVSLLKESQLVTNKTNRLTIDNYAISNNKKAVNLLRLPPLFFCF